jgi:serine/threonine-protein kinase
LTGWKRWGPLDTLAAACAEAGDSAGAVKWLKAALGAGPPKGESEEMRARLRLYEQGKPYREK